jgi:hypothetical protein
MYVTTYRLAQYLISGKQYIHNLQSVTTFLMFKLLTIHLAQYKIRPLLRSLSDLQTRIYITT